MDEIKRPKLLAETVLNHLRELIVQGDLKLGQVISERQLADRLKVSKTPVREAMAQLRVEGLVKIEPQKGASVFTLGANEVTEICDFRQIIEIQALSMSLDRARQALVDEISIVVDRMYEALALEDTRQYLALDTRFHRALFKHCDNSYLLETYMRYAGKIAALRTHVATKPRHTSLSMREHEDLLAALKDGSRQDAINILKAHIDRTRGTYAAEITDIALADASFPEGARP
ncbi:GntR family transcriptional regulator [uncultured Cohaesibacter sp.]|uniref:GntR family transcriptional regulator n=1 Tax=uncultured Cohaesibacter sp. TaxID=1002546 RepID=UPI0029C93605|nr:GntR family transcriptional regulator [uncultured Cohaesibacter sp.]